MVSAMIPLETPQLVLFLLLAQAQLYGAAPVRVWLGPVAVPVPDLSVARN